MDLDADSLERIVPDELRTEDRTGAETLRLSVERYEFAAGFLGEGRVLDLEGVGAPAPPLFCFGFIGFQSIELC